MTNIEEDFKYITQSYTVGHTVTETVQYSVATAVLTI